MKTRNARRLLRAAACLCLTGLLLPGAVQGQGPGAAVPPPPTPLGGQPMPPPAPPSAHALPPPPPETPPQSPFAPGAPAAGSPFTPASGPASPSGRPRLLRRQRDASTPPARGRLRERIRGLFGGGNPR
jgi:hypothetical protein